MKQVFKQIVVVAMLFVVPGVFAARKIVGQEADALFAVPSQPEAVKPANSNDDSAVITLEDQELLNRDSIKDLALQTEENDLELPTEDENKETDELALNEDMFNPEEFEAFMNSPEAKEMIAQVEDMQKNNPEEFKKMMEEAEKMMLAMQQGEGFDLGSDAQASELPAAAAAA